MRFFSYCMYLPKQCRGCKLRPAWGPEIINSVFLSPQRIFEIFKISRQPLKVGRFHIRIHILGFLKNQGVWQLWVSSMQSSIRGSWVLPAPLQNACIFLFITFPLVISFPSYLPGSCRLLHLQLLWRHSINELRTETLHSVNTARQQLVPILMGNMFVLSSYNQKSYFSH